jgi:hypothetical protein
MNCGKKCFFLFSKQNENMKIYAETRAFKAVFIRPWSATVRQAAHGGPQAFMVENH